MLSILAKLGKTPEKCCLNLRDVYRCGKVAILCSFLVDCTKYIEQHMFYLLIEDCFALSESEATRIAKLLDGS